MADRIGYLQAKLQEAKDGIGSATVDVSSGTLLNLWNTMEKLADVLGGALAEIRDMRLEQEKRDDHAQERRDRRG